jgi:hypothetical protein
MKRDRDNSFKRKVFELYFVPEPTQRAGKIDLSLIFKALDGLGQNALIDRRSPSPVVSKLFLETVGT